MILACDPVLCLVYLQLLQLIFWTSYLLPEALLLLLKETVWSERYNVHCYRGCQAGSTWNEGGLHATYRAQGLMSIRQAYLGAAIISLHPLPAASEDTTGKSSVGSKSYNFILYLA